MSYKILHLNKNLHEDEYTVCRYIFLQKHVKIETSTVGLASKQTFLHLIYVLNLKCLVPTLIPLFPTKKLDIRRAL